MIVKLKEAGSGWMGPQSHTQTGHRAAIIEMSTNLMGLLWRTVV